LRDEVREPARECVHIAWREARDAEEMLDVRARMRFDARNGRQQCGSRAGREGFALTFRFSRPNPRRAFSGRNLQTAEAIEIAASKGMKFTAGAGFVFAVS
jgi:hypothetical protein